MATLKTLTAAQYRTVADPGNYTLNSETGLYERNPNAPMGNPAAAAPWPGSPASPGVPPLPGTPGAAHGSPAWPGGPVGAQTFITPEQLARLPDAERANWRHDHVTGNYTRLTDTPEASLPATLSREEWEASPDRAGYALNPQTGEYQRNMGALAGSRYRPTLLTDGEHSAVSDPGNYTRNASGLWERNPDLGLVMEQYRDHPLFRCAARLEALTGKLDSGLGAAEVARLREGFTREIAHLRALVTGQADPYNPAPPATEPGPRR